MTIDELVRWRDDNRLPDTWYLEINEQGLGEVMTLASVSRFAREVWRNGGQISIVHVSRAGNDANWIVLLPDAKVSESVCPCCGSECESLVGTFPGKGLSGWEWIGAVVFVFFALGIGITSGASYGWLLFAFVFVVLVSRFFRRKLPIWRCPVCHRTRSRKE